MIDLIHFVNRPVALDTTDAAIDVHGMVEINKVRDAMNLYPRDGFSAKGALANQGEPRIVLQDLVMAVHASRTGGNIRIPGLFNRIMAIAAINSQLSGMRGMREADRLDRLITDAGVLRGEVVPGACDQCTTDQHGAGNHQHRQAVSPFGEDG